MPPSALFRSAKNKLMKYTPAQIKVRDATSNEEAPPRDGLLIEIAALSFNPLFLDQMVTVLMKRLNDDSKNWRHIHKSLIVYEFMVVHGSETLLTFLKNNRHYFEALKCFQYYKDAHDCGRIIRGLAARIIDLITDEDLLQKARDDSRHTIELVKNKWSNEGSSIVGNQSLDDYQNKFAESSRDTVSKAASLHRPLTSSQRTLSDDMKKAIPVSKDEEETQLQLALKLSEEETSSRRGHPQPSFQNIQETSVPTQQQPATKMSSIDELFSIDFAKLSTETAKPAAADPNIIFDPFSVPSAVPPSQNFAQQQPTNTQLDFYPFYQPNDQIGLSNTTPLQGFNAFDSMAQPSPSLQQNPSYPHVQFSNAPYQPSLFGSNFNTGSQPQQMYGTNFQAAPVAQNSFYNPVPNQTYDADPFASLNASFNRPLNENPNPLEAKPNLQKVGLDGSKDKAIQKSSNPFLD